MKVGSIAAQAQAESEARQQRFVRLACAIIAGSSLAYLAALPWLAPGAPFRAIAPLLFLLVCACVLVLQGRIGALPSGLLFSYGILAASLFVGFSGGVRTPAIYSLPILIGLSAWLTAPRHAVIITLIAMAGTFGLTVAEVNGALNPRGPLPPYAAWFALVALLIIAAILAIIVKRAFQLQLDQLNSLSEALSRQVEELDAEKSQLRLVAENVPVMLFHGDRDKRCLYANRNYAAFYAAERENLTGRTVREILGKQAYAKLDSNLDRVLAGERLAYRGVRTSSAGEERTLDVDLVPESDDAGHTHGFFALMKDVTEQVLTEEALRRSEEKFAKVFRSSPLAIAITRLSDGCYLDVNDAFERHFGWPREEVIGRTSLEIGKWLTPEDRQGWAAVLKQAGRISNHEVCFRTRNGDIREVLLSAELIDLEGEPCALVLAADITESKQAEEKFAKVFQASPVAISIARLHDGHYIDVNEAFVRQFGWSREEILGRTSVEIGIWHCLADRERWIAELRKSGRLKSYEASIRIKSGEQRTALMSAEPLSLDGEECVLNSVHDITELRRTEDALRQSEARLQEAQRIGHVGSWDLDLASLRLAWSDEIHKIYERGQDAFGGTFQDLLTMVHPDDLDCIRTIFRDSGKAAGRYEIDHRIITPDGRVKHLHVQWEVFLDSGGKPLRALGTAQDITAQMLAKEEIHRLNAELENRVRERTAELQSANKELESFAYSISHDLRAPLRGIDGFSHLLAEEYGERLDALGHSYLERVRAAAQRMGALIDDILELSRVTRHSMRRSQMDLSRLAQEILDELKQGAPARALTVSLAEGCTAFGDPQLLRVLMQNLLENAWKYSSKEASPKIEFGRETLEGETVFFVRDNGVGFDMKYADRLFTPFQRLHKPEEFEGTGIGLATVARIVHRHGGRVWAESEPGKGTTIRFALPL
jgi:PAS domain S-box-containing protein